MKKMPFTSNFYYTYKIRNNLNSKILRKQQHICAIPAKVKKIIMMINLLHDVERVAVAERLAVKVRVQP